MKESRNDGTPDGTRPEVSAAVIGCGAVAAKRYLPAPDRIPGPSVTHVVDLDLDRARALAAEYGVGEAAADHRQVLERVDAAVVATPPETHREIVTACLEAGVHVLCEKPLASQVDDAEAMVRAAESSPALLSVAMVRRLGRSAILLRRCAASGLAGRIERIELEEGGEFGWPLRTGHVFEAGQGGVLRDTGVHLLDLAVWNVDAREARVTAYEDDSWGGPEANARVELAAEGRDGPVEAAVEVSFTRELDNRITVRGSAGTLEGSTSGGAEIVFRPSDGGEPIRLVAGDGGSRSRTDDFVIQLEGFLRAVRTGGVPPVAAAEAVLPLRIIEECYGRRSESVRPWELPPGEELTGTRPVPNDSSGGVPAHV
jgi:predicted dehydrogenase